MISGIVQSISGMLSRCSGRLGAFVTFAVAVYLGEELTVAKVKNYSFFYNFFQLIIKLRNACGRICVILILTV